MLTYIVTVQNLGSEYHTTAYPAGNVDLSENGRIIEARAQVDEPSFAMDSEAYESAAAAIASALPEPGEWPELVLPDGKCYPGKLQHDDDGRAIVMTATCGECGFSWNDALITSITPTPAGRCPNEYGHKEVEDES